MSALLLLLPLACHPDPDPPKPSPSVDRIDPKLALVRASMGLLGVRPSPADLEKVADDPDTLDAIIEGYLDDPRFGETIRDMHAEQFHLRWDVSGHIPPAGPLLSVSSTDLIVAVDETPLKLIEWIVTEGRPYSEIVTSDVVFANPITAVTYGLPYDPAGPEWQPSSYPDARPAAGILVDNNLFMRFPSSVANLNRSRANAVVEGLMCDTVAERPLQFEIFDPRDDFDAENPTCTACHAVLDPIASAFADIRVSLQPAEVTEAYAEGCPPDLAWACFPVALWEPGGEQPINPAEPAFYGTPVSDLGDLGQVITEDPRFASCTARRFYSWFAQIPVEQVPFEVWSELTEGFLDSGLDARSLALASVRHASTGPLANARPDQYARMVEDLTGYRWTGTPDAPGCVICVGEVDLARHDRYGNHTLLGGADGYLVLDPTHDPSPTRFLAQAWFAEEAAAYVVDHDVISPPSERRLLLGADPLDISQEAVHAQLQYLHARITSELDADTELTEALFFDALARHGDTIEGKVAAWRLVVTALLLDDAAVVY